MHVQVVLSQRDFFSVRAFAGTSKFWSFLLFSTNDITLIVLRGAVHKLRYNIRLVIVGQPNANLVKVLTRLVGWSKNCKIVLSLFVNGPWLVKRGVDGRNFVITPYTCRNLDLPRLKIAKPNSSSLTLQILIRIILARS